MKSLPLGSEFHLTTDCLCTRVFLLIIHSCFKFGKIISKCIIVYQTFQHGGEMINDHVDRIVN